MLVLLSACPTGARCALSLADWRLSGQVRGRAACVSELVTGEAVALELRPAKLPSRDAAAD